MEGMHEAKARNCLHGAVLINIATSCVSVWRRFRCFELTRKSYNITPPRRVTVTRYCNVTRYIYIYIYAYANIFVTAAASLAYVCIAFQSARCTIRDDDVATTGKYVGLEIVIIPLWRSLFGYYKYIRVFFRTCIATRSATAIVRNNVTVCVTVNVNMEIYTAPLWSDK